MHEIHSLEGNFIIQNVKIGNEFIHLIINGNSHTQKSTDNFRINLYYIFL